MIENKIDFSIVPDSTKEEALNPTANLIGQALKGIAHKILDPLVRYNIVKEQEMQDFSEKIKNRTTSIPIENRDPEKLGLTLKAVEDASYQLNSEKLREMFANLISSTVDDRVNSDIHPSFSSILKDLSTKDAILFEIIFKQKSLPIVTVRIEESKSANGVNLKENIILLENQDIDESVALNNLSRFGLIEIFPDKFLVAKEFSERYQKFKDTQYFKQEESKLPIITGGYTLDKLILKNGRIDITPLGENFGNIVISPE